ncbi:hypothetical protein BH23VER1_BH23VER1_14420 [soil metagenome]
MPPPPLALLGYYVHDLSPFLLRFPGGFGIRWYGLAYVLGFFLGFLLLRHLARRNLSQLKPEQVSDFVTFAALFGVLLGGRLGYMLLYDFDKFSANPLHFFNVLGGGMASHGGIAGLAVFSYFYARKHRLSWLGLGDDLVVAAPIGLFLGRCANFINGELYGRITTVPWAIIFPDSLREENSVTGGSPYKMWDELRAASPDLASPENPANSVALVSEAVRHSPEVREILASYLAPRHPSQIYEALLEGLALFLILLILRLRVKNLPHGLLTGLFFLLYAVFRIFAEAFRQPDIGQSAILGLTRGQFYSTFMIAIGIIFLTVALLRGNKLSSP